jgi:protease PrsW
MSFALALLPGIVLALLIYWKDRSEPEPYSALLLTALYGVLVFFMARGLGYLLHQFIYVNDQGVFYNMISAFLFVGLLAEVSKFLILRGIVFYTKNFNHAFDGIVYAVMLGLGYATAENVLMVMHKTGDVSVLRMFSNVPANAVFAVIMGFFLGEAKFVKNKMFVYSVLALFGAAIAHGYYDYFMQLMNVQGLWMEAGISLIIVILLVQLGYRRLRAIDPK